MTSKSADLGTTFEEAFDHIVVANGSDSRPFIPHIGGLWDWKGEILHSRWYRDPKAFAGKVSPGLGSSRDHKLRTWQTVMVMGAGPSSERSLLPFFVLLS